MTTMATTKELEKQIKDLQDQVSALEEVIVNVPNASVKPDEADINRNQLRLIMARAGMVRREFAKTDAQAVDRAIDEILKVWK